MALYVAKSRDLVLVQRPEYYNEEKYYVSKK